MIEVAFAYQKTGNINNFNQTMERIENSLAKLANQDVDNVEVDRTSSAYHALRMDKDATMTALNETIRRAGNPVPLVKSWPMFEPFEGDKVFREAQNKQTERINQYRTELGLKTLKTGY